MKKKNILKITALILAGLMCLAPLIPGILAYLTDMGDIMMNPFTIALDSTSTVVEKYPAPEDNPNTPVPNGNLIAYEKAVQIGNTGYIDCYVRCSIDFSEDDIRNKSKFSWDGKNFYSVSEYSKHLPEGWIYNSNDGFYYYKPILTSDWDRVKDRLTYDKLWGEYFYPEKQKDIIVDSAISTPLIRYVRTEFSSPEDMRTYDIHVYSESVPFYFGNDYKQSWENYLDMMRE